jgi:hypothetical protein
MSVIEQARIGLEWLRVMEAASAEIANPFKRWWFRLGLRQGIRFTKYFLENAKAAYARQ